MKLAFPVATTFILFGFLAIPAVARDTPNGIASGNSDQAVCMARPRDNSPQVRAQDRGKRVFVAVLPRAVSGFEANGFKKLNCKAAGFRKASDLAAYRDEMCKAASLGNEAVQNQLAQFLGEFPSVLCANAERIAGRWQPDAKRQK